jgi:hypothetical protein
MFSLLHVFNIRVISQKRKPKYNESLLHTEFIPNRKKPDDLIRDSRRLFSHLTSCNTLCLTLREGHSWGVWEQRTGDNIWTSKRDKVTDCWRKLHIEELHDMSSSPNIIRTTDTGRTRWEGQVARMVEKRNVNRSLASKPERKRPHRRHRHRWEDSTKLDLQENVWEAANLLIG